MDTRVVLRGEIDVEDRRSQKKIAKQLKKIPGVVEVLLETGEVTVMGMGDAATMKAQLEDKLGNPVEVLVDLAAAPPPPPPPVGGGYGVMPHSSAAPLYAPAVGGGYQPHGYGAMRPPSAVPFFTHPAPPLGPYVGYPQPPYAAPPLQAGYYYVPTHAPAGTFKDEFDHGRCGCSIL